MYIHVYIQLHTHLHCTYFNALLCYSICIHVLCIFIFSVFRLLFHLCTVHVLFFKCYSICIHVLYIYTLVTVTCSVHVSAFAYMYMYMTTGLATEKATQYNSDSWDSYSLFWTDALPTELQQGSSAVWVEQHGN